MSKAKKKSKSKKIVNNSSSVESIDENNDEAEFINRFTGAQDQFDPLILLNHFKKIQEIDEKVLEWSPSESLNVEESSKMVDSVVHDQISKSIESSHFSDYFKSEMTTKCESNHLSVCGALISEDNNLTMRESVNEVVKAYKNEPSSEGIFESKDQEQEVINEISCTSLKRSRRSTGVKDYRKMANPTLNEAIESNYTKESISRQNSTPKVPSINNNVNNSKIKANLEITEPSKKEKGVIDKSPVNNSKIKVNVELTEPSKKEKGVIDKDIKMEVIVSLEEKENASIDGNSDSSKIVCNNCEKRCDHSSLATNFCQDCYGLLSRELQKYNSWKDLICIEKPTCWESQENEKCQACQIQYIIRNGITIVDNCSHSEILSRTVEQLRTVENTELGRQYYKEYVKNCIIASKCGLDKVPNPFIVSTNCDATDLQYDWCISEIERLSPENSVHNLCSFCSNRHDKTVFYKFLNDPSMFVCNYCLTRGQKIALSYKDETVACECEGCDDFDNCDNCFSVKFFDKFTRDSLAYKYKVENRKKCRFCYRPRNLRWFDSGYRVCFLCIWRVNEYLFDGEEECAHNLSDCFTLSCNSCLYKVVKVLVDIKCLINHRIPLQAFKNNIFNTNVTTKPKKRNLSEVNGTEKETIPSKTQKLDGNSITSDDISTKRKSIKPKSIVDVADTTSNVQEQNSVKKCVKHDLDSNDQVNVIKDTPFGTLAPCKPRIKQATKSPSNSDALDLDKASESLVNLNKSNGPRVKNVSRKSVKEIILDNAYTSSNVHKIEQNLLPLRARSEDVQSMNNDSENRMEVSEIEAIDDSDIGEIPLNSVVGTCEDGNSECSASVESYLECGYEKCGYCQNCMRSRNCGKCYNCQQRRTSKSKSFVCIMQQCTSPKKQQNRTRRLRLQNQNISTNDTSTTKYLGQGPKMEGNTIIGGTKPLSEVYQADFSHHSSSTSKKSSRKSVEYKPEDISKDSLKILINGQLSKSIISGKSEHGFPIITTKRGAPANFVCFTCGSGDGDQMINCSQCANPYHFFCIDLPYRPKSKELYKCRRCTECNLCHAENSDLKCIKCGLGYHGRCYNTSNTNNSSMANRYPPALNVNSPVDWVCHLCAMCLHCGESGKHLMDITNSGGADEDENVPVQNQVEWSTEDPFCCARCQEAVDNGEVCANCARAVIAPSNASENDQLSCNRCHQVLHRQCVPLKEDEYELWKRVQLPEVRIYCKKCHKKCQNQNINGASSNNSTKSETVQKQSKPQINKLMKSAIERGEKCEQELIDKMSDNMINQQHMHHQPRTFSQVDGQMSESESPVKIIMQYDGVSNCTDEEDEKRDIDVKELPTSNSKNKYSNSNNVDNSTESPVEADYLDEEGIANSSALSPVSEISELHKQSSHTAKMGLIDICKNRYNRPSVQYSHSFVQSGRSYFNNPIFSGLKPDSFISCKHMICEIAARIIFKINRLSSKSESSELVRSTYRKLLRILQDITNEFFPWVDFQKCKLVAEELITGDLNYKIPKIINLIHQKMEESQHKEERVYNSTLKEVIKKFRDSQERSRDEFVRHHTEQHISALEKAVTKDDSNDNEFDDNNHGGFGSRYDIKYESPSKTIKEALLIKDERTCVLCKRGNDDKIEGRLLYAGLDVWIHVNCAMWSVEVYEKNEHGVLDGVRKAVENGLRQICSECGEYGATLPCSGIEYRKAGSNHTRSQTSSCRNIFHFNCAYNKLSDPVFTVSRQFFCSEALHNSQVAKKIRSHDRLGLSDMLILRRIVLRFGCLEGIKGLTEQCKREQTSDDIIVTIGGLRVDCLGKIDKEVSGVFKSYLVPVQFSARRLFWSAMRPDKLTVYKLNTYKDTRTLPIQSSLLGHKASRSIHSSASSLQSVPNKQRYSNVHTSHKRMSALSCRPVLQIDDDGQLQCNKRYSDSEDDYDDDETNGSFMSRFRNPRPPSNNRFKSLLNIKYDRPIHKSSIISRNLKRSYPSSNQTDKTPTDNKTLVSDSHIINPIKPNLTPVNNQQYHHSIMSLPNHIPLAPKPSNMLSSQTINNTGRHSIDFGSSIRLIKNQTPNLVNMVQRRHTINHATPKIVIKSFNNGYVKHPSQLSTNIQTNRKPSFTSTNYTNSNIPRVTSLTSITPTSMNHNPYNTTSHHQSIGSNTKNYSTDGSVLRNVLTTGRSAQITNVANGSDQLVGTAQSVNHNESLSSFQAFPSKPWYNNAANSLKIISCGTLNKTPTHKVNIHQYDGVLTSDDNREECEYDDEDDDSLSVVSSNISSNVHTERLYKRPVGIDRAPVNFSHSNSVKAKPRAVEDGQSNSIIRFSIYGWAVSKNPNTAWDRINKKIIDVRRQINNCRGVRSQQSSFRNIKMTYDGWSKFGLDNKHLVYLLEQMKDAFLCEQYEFKLHKERAQQFKEMFIPTQVIPQGVSRFVPRESTLNRNPEHIRDPLNFLACQANKPPPIQSKCNKRKNTNDYGDSDLSEDDKEVTRITDGSDVQVDQRYISGLAVQFMRLQTGRNARINNVQVYRSTIHERGLFSQRSYDAHELVIEYVGELIRASVSDIRETKYQRKGVDCYMFKLDRDTVIDATIKGNAARFINHSCNPNCYAKIVKLHGYKHILIITSRAIKKGEEFTYDYQFPAEDDKVECKCGAFSCRKYLN